MRPKRATFDIATREQGREQRTGYVLGDWATHKDRGEYFWTFTHLPAGVSIGAYPCHETKASALAHLEHLHAHGPGELRARTLSEHGGKWGLGF